MDLPLKFLLEQKCQRRKDRNYQQKRPAQPGKHRVSGIQFAEEVTDG